MSYNVFICYSTKDLPIVDRLRKSLAYPGINVFVAEYSLDPGSNLNEGIIKAIQGCDLFVLLWSRNSRYSEYVPQEIGLAKGFNRCILPIVLDRKLKLPGFIKELKYLPVYSKPHESIEWLKQHVSSRAQQRQKSDGLRAVVLIGLSAMLLWLLGQK